MSEAQKSREECVELIRHPLNRSFFENVIEILRPKGMYGCPLFGVEVFTREELEEALKGVK